MRIVDRRVLCECDKESIVPVCICRFELIIFVVEDDDDRKSFD
jgi:hypothetical protein